MSRPKHQGTETAFPKNGKPPKAGLCHFCDTREALPLSEGLAFGRSFLLYHRGGFHFPPPWPKGKPPNLPTRGSFLLPKGGKLLEARDLGQQEAGAEQPERWQKMGHGIQTSTGVKNDAVNLFLFAGAQTQNGGPFWRPLKNHGASFSLCVCVCFLSSSFWGGAQKDTPIQLQPLSSNES